MYNGACLCLSINPYYISSHPFFHEKTKYIEVKLVPLPNFINMFSNVANHYQMVTMCDVDTMLHQGPKL
ncbi:hypothetical protein CR513_48648, partial [Mucuna pruriens]